ncbi:sugar transferase [Telmatocola sphagniphila]|uniref:Sugar transferase n=1 Tax=Telmatocola sphagniphila TaxID=1123043 RepID=A0A8E6B4P6_9BACT|nr:sugar transferase [Telmatocola sphagniphila]QVL31872.1 sugar transferase [Telmatocola sphagniphila]
MAAVLLDAEPIATVKAPVRRPIPEAGLAVGRLYTIAKRTTDIVVALGAIIALAPLGFVVALLIKLTDMGPVFFVQKRIGKDGKAFSFIKFRSMIVNADQLKMTLSKHSHHGDSITFKMKRDPRITWIGSIIRKTSIDELPQLFNVLTGEMSLVGPRPAVPSEVARYEPRHKGRLAVQPGITCIWQVRGRGDIPFEQQVKMDLEYINRRSWWYDLILMVETVPAVLTGRGAY